MQELLKLALGLSVVWFMFNPQENTLCRLLMFRILQEKKHAGHLLQAKRINTSEHGNGNREL